MAIPGAFCGKQGAPFFLSDPLNLLILQQVRLLRLSRFESHLTPCLGAHMRLSIEFLSLVLRQLHFPESASAHPGLFDYAKLSQAHILELGCVL